MQCPACGHANSDDARFCANCGNSLELVCPNCGAPHQPGQRFCDQCGTALAVDETPGASPAADDLSRWVPAELLRKIDAARAGQTMRGERRTVTMLFADIQGSTSAAEQLDPEEWAEIVNETFGVLIEPIYRYEGTLARLQGDAILAFFGAPIAHEDDPLRAVRAGLDIVTEIEQHQSDAAKRLAVPISVRVGINTGLVVVGEVGSDLRVEYTALGDAINVAARMEQTADPGTVRITHETLELLGNAVATTPLGPVEVKGRSEPVDSHQVVAILDAADRSTGRDTPLVGRGEELAKLDELVDRLEAGLGGICTLVGEAGMGKTRLLLALRERLDGRVSLGTVTGTSADVAWLQARARSYETSLPHAVFGHLLTPWLGGREALATRGCVEQALESLDTPMDADVPLLLSALLDGAQSEREQEYVDSLEPKALHVRTTEAVKSLLTAEAAERPVVVVLDDVHWADSVSLELAEQLMGLTEASPLLLVLMMRPMRDDPSWRIVEVAARDHGHRHTSIDLEALPDEATSELLATLLDDSGIDDKLRTDILRRAAGNPLFVEEMAHSLAEMRDDDGDDPASRRRLTVPRSLTSLLTSRLDRLDESTRHVAQVASVVGREFSIGALSALVDDGEDFAADIHELLRREILEERRRLPESVYAFRHPLIAETAYSTILLRTRRELHERVARHLEDMDADAVAEIARHWVEAGQPSTAFPYLVEAGRRANRVMALGAAIPTFTTALENVPEDADPDLVTAAYDGLGEAWSRVPDLSQASSAYQSLLEHGRSTGKPTVQVTALNRLGYSTATIAGDFDKALDYLDEARALAEDCGDDYGLAEYHMNACLVTAAMGNTDEALQHDEATARIGARMGSEHILLTGLLRRTLNLASTMRFDEALQSYEETLASARDEGDELLKALLHTEVEALLAMRDGRLREATEILQEYIPEIDAHLSPFGGAQHERLANAALMLGDFELALAEYAAADRYGEQIGQVGYTALGHAGRAHVLAFIDSGADIEDLAELAAETARAPAGEWASTGVLADLGFARLHSGDLDDAKDLFAEALASSSMTRSWELPRVLLGAARVALMTGASEDAGRWLDEVRAYMAQHELLLHEPELFLLDGWAAELDGRDDDAATILTESVRAATEFGRRPLRIDALRRLAAVRRRQGDDMEAAAIDERAEKVAREIASEIADEGLRHAWERRTLTADTPGAPTG